MNRISAAPRTELANVSATRRAMRSKPLSRGLFFDRTGQSTGRASKKCETPLTGCVRIKIRTAWAPPQLLNSQSRSELSQPQMSQSGPGGMAKLHIDLLGGCSVGLDGNGPCFLPTKKSQALLAYLAVPAGRFHAREKLTAMFWGDTPEALARQSFRQALVS